ncbi:MAG: hypothetical protein RI995_1857 [Bacteroidota bacterium]
MLIFVAMKLNNALLLGFVLMLTLSSCGKFEKFRKSASLPKKYEAAIKYYKTKEFDKAGILFDEILPLMKGDSTQELATFYQAKCDFELGNYTLAGTHFKKFAEVFSRSEMAEESIYMAAYSMFKDSPNYNLDQAATLSAINELQGYINNYPESKFREDCTKMIKDLRKKLEKKAFEKAKLYFKTSPFNIAALKSAVIEATNFQRDFPDSEFNEEVAFLKLQSQFALAKTTIETKQRERYEEAGKFYLELIDKYPKSAFLPQAEKMYSESLKEAERIAKLEAEYKALQEKEKSNTSKVATSPK